MLAALLFSLAQEVLALLPVVPFAIGNSNWAREGAKHYLANSSCQEETETAHLKQHLSVFTLL